MVETEGEQIYNNTFPYQNSLSSWPKLCCFPYWGGGRRGGPISDIPRHFFAISEIPNIFKPFSDSEIVLLSNFRIMKFTNICVVAWVFPWISSQLKAINTTIQVRSLHS